MNLELICPECKNNVDLSKHKEVKEGKIVECSLCGIILEIVEIKEGKVKTEIVDEGK